MADKIVSWGGIDSKGTTGMGVTGSFTVSGSLFRVNAATASFIGSSSIGPYFSIAPTIAGTGPAYQNLIAAQINPSFTQSATFGVYTTALQTTRGDIELLEGGAVVVAGTAGSGNDATVPFLVQGYRDAGYNNNIFLSAKSGSVGIGASVNGGGGAGSNGLLNPSYGNPRNVLIGAGAGSVGNISDNVLIGYKAFYPGNISNSGNVIIGSQAVGNGATGGVNNNVILGYQAFYTPGRGGSGRANTVAIGYQANYSGSDSGVYIGYQAGLNEISSGKLYIANTSTSTPLIGGDFTNARLGVNISPSSTSATLHVKGSGTTSSTTALLVQNANASSSFSIKDNGDSTFFYSGVVGHSLKISGSYSGNGSSAIYETLGATGGYYGIHEFRVGTNTANAVRAMSIVYGGRVVIGNKSDTVLQFPGANLLIDTNVINTFTSQSFNTGIKINPSGSLDTRFTASGILFNWYPEESNGGAFVGSQYNPATNGYDSDLVIYNSQGNAGSYVETARFVGKSKSLSLGAGRNPSASLHISSSNSALLEIDSPAVNNILFVSGSGNVGIGTSNPTVALEVSGSIISKAGMLSTGSISHRGSFKLQGEPIAYGSLPYTGSWQDMIVFTPGANLGGGSYLYPQFYVTWGGSTTTITGGTLSTSSPASNVNALSLSAGGRNFSIYPYEQYISSTRNLNLLPGSSYNVGINTQSPTAKLHIVGQGTTNSTTALLVQNANTSGSMVVLDNGNVGIGASTPISLLQIGSGSGFLGDVTTPAVTFNNINNGIYLDSNRISFKAGGGFSFAADSNGIIGNGFRINTSLFNDLITPIFVASRLSLGINSGYGGNNAGHLSLITSGSSRIYVDYSGNVGIGTSTPSASLHVSGAILNYPITLPTASGTASMDCSKSNFFNLTLSGSYTLFLSASNIQPGQTINLRVTQPATSGSLNYGSQFKFAGGIPYSASATSLTVDIISFISFDTTTLYGSAIKNLS
jgi:hypothetical protein